LSKGYERWHFLVGRIAQPDRSTVAAAISGCQFPAARPDRRPIAPGREALERIVRAAAEARLRLVRRDGEEVRVGEGVLVSPCR
jgi:hypothetical protein